MLSDACGALSADWYRGLCILVFLMRRSTLAFQLVSVCSVVPHASAYAAGRPSGPQTDYMGYLFLDARLP